MVTITTERPPGKEKYLFILLFCFASFYLYRPIFIDIKILKVVYGFFLALLVLSLFKGKKKGEKKLKSGKLTFAVRLLIFSMLFSIIPAYASWGQSFNITFIATVPYLSYMLYFYLRKYQISREVLEKVIYTIGVTCLVFYFFAFAAFPTVIFGAHTADEISDDRGFARIIIGGLGFIYLLYFLALNNYLTTKKRKWLIIAFLALVGVFMTLTRQAILSCMLLGMYLVYTRLNLGKRFIVFSLIATVSVTVLPNLKFVQLLVNKTQDESSDVKGNIRYEAAQYFLNDFPPDGLARIFGNGEPSLGNSYFGIFTHSVELDERYFQSDVGFIGLYSKFGILAIAAWLIAFGIVIFKKFPPDLIYLKLFVILILFTGLTSSMPFNENDIAAISICFYLADSAMDMTQRKKGKVRYNYDWSQHLAEINTDDAESSNTNLLTP